MNNKNTVTRIDTVTLQKLRYLAGQDYRTVPATLALLVEAELTRRGIDFLPAPEDAELVPVIGGNNDRHPG